ERGGGVHVRRPGRGGGERDLGVRGQGVSRFLEPGRLHREPQQGVLVQAENPIVDVYLEEQQAGPAELVDSAPHRGLVPVDRRGQRGRTSPAVAGQLFQQRFVLGQERLGGRGGPEGTAGEFLQLGRGQRPGRFAPWARGEVMQDRV